MEGAITIAYGLVSLISLGAMFSSFSGLSVGICFSIVLGSSLAILIFRAVSNSLYRSTIFRSIKYFYAPFLIFGTFLSFIVSRTGLDFASRNFDAYYGIQDGIYLSGHASYNLLASSKEILPLTWSASTNDRYGVSYLIAFLQHLGIGNPWLNAQYVMLFNIILLIVLIIALLNRIFLLNRYEKILVFTVISFSPAILIPIEYFMFGQVLGLVASVLVLSILTYWSLDTRALIYALLYSVALLVIYPAMFFPLSLFWIMFALLQRNISIKRRIYGILVFSSATVLLAIIQFGFRASVLWARVWSWISGSLLSQSGINDLEFPVKVFGQYSSKIGIPLFVGLVRYPYTFVNSQMSVMIFLVLSIAIFISAFLLIHGIMDKFTRSILVSFVLSWLSMAFVAYIKGNSYVFLKFSTWTMPVILGLSCLAVMRNGSLFAAKLRFMAKPLSIAGVISLSLSLITASSYASTLRTWDSFPQVPKPPVYKLLQDFKIQGQGRIAVVAPSAEEATWTAAQFESISQKRFLSLGVINQALGAGLGSDCTFNQAQRDFGTVDYLLTNLAQWDVVPPLIFSGTPEFNVGGLSFSRAMNLKSGIVINSGGLFPPSKINSYDGKSIPSGALRWSKGEVCLAIFSDVTKYTDLKVNFFSGPDLPNKVPWEITVNGITRKESYIPEILTHRVQLSSGWNLVQIVQPGCRNVHGWHIGRWTDRADDRQLCFAVTSVNG